MPVDAQDSAAKPAQQTTESPLLPLSPPAFSVRVRQMINALFAVFITESVTGE